MAHLQLITRIDKCKYNATKVHGCDDSNHQDAVINNKLLHQWQEHIVRWAKHDLAVILVYVLLPVDQ